ncbi:hypothetical protein DPMN_012460 [Dreissena polymorpha]|uniref:Uncharacterized protein n=1 Tax=Dreissena polymorpha TaxID=45954 RepID=A0A9D4N3G6_DREPO|nr:hypothetical protein DPMN_012460 [Dreissena polymorpha]
MRCLQKSSCHASHSETRLFRSYKLYGLASRQLKSIIGRKQRRKPLSHADAKRRFRRIQNQPGGKLITSDAYIEEVEMYDAKKNVNAVTSHSQMICKSPRPSITGIQKLHANIVSEDSDTESDTYDTGKCCVCGQFSPTNLDTRPHIKIVNWGQCDESGHWVHPSFCHTKSVLRRGDSFPCPHCC